MFPAMRRSDKALPEREVSDMLQHCTSGVLALCGKDGYPYAVPVSHGISEAFSTGSQAHQPPQPSS